MSRELKPFRREEEIFRKDYGKEFHDVCGYRSWRIYCGDVLVGRIIKLKDHKTNEWYFRPSTGYGVSSIGAFNRALIQKKDYKTIPAAMKEGKEKEVIPNLLKKRYESYQDAKDALIKSIEFQLSQFYIE